VWLLGGHWAAGHGAAGLTPRLHYTTVTDYSSTNHDGLRAGTKISNILENKQPMEDSHTDPHPYVGSVPVESDVGTPRCKDPKLI